MTILVCGDREWTDAEKMWTRLRQIDVSTYEEEIVLVEGDCRGADRMAGRIGIELGMKVVPVPAEWDKHGRSAGPIRNRKMLDEYKPRLVIGFHKSLWTSKGTLDCMREAAKRGIKVELVQ